ncbi:DNA cytosine methyltransferase [Streptomyces sp. AS02]|uniref:DNA cytosine methyltransferase n=1 Tax=Streptomyces sp. AS02 TaxID=2938946 RepID=UPI00202043D6|nr:DNA cytosine methyltransferase [Streptomyces sp. AS02]MCL8016945.1 DNA cytosine methyltransferase [Streptomyces sp. AS02]
MTLRIGSLFTGTGALDLAVMDVFDAEVVWHAQYEPPDKHGKEDKNQYAAKILARHWPTVPNLWDITKVCWQCVIEEHGRPHILTGGFPCTDVSSAGKRAGLTPDTRSGLWTHMSYAISILQPRLVIIENVEGLLSAPADRGLGLDAEALEEEARAGRILRALGAVLGDLASLGFHAEWARVAASEVGAPHPRKRVFVLAWPAAPDAPHLGHERAGLARRRGAGSTDGDLPAADAHSHGLQGERSNAGAQPERTSAAPVGRGSAGGCLLATDPDRGGLQGHGELPAGRNAIRVGIRHDTDGRHPTPTDPTRVGRGEGRSEPARLLRGPDAAEPGSAASPDADSLRWRAKVLELRPGQPDLDWGAYEPAIRRWEAILGRSAPWPTDLRGRLTPVFSEWLMGLPDGWVTYTPGPEDMSPAAQRNAMLRALGNGVVPRQAAAAIRLLADRAGIWAEVAA